MAEILGRPVTLTAPASCASLAEYIGYFEPQIEALQTAAHLERCAREVVEDAAADGLDYLEVRWAPRLHTRQGLALEAGIEGVLAGLAAGPIRAAGIACALRYDSLEEMVELARIAARYRDQGLVGFDLAGDEARWPNDGSAGPAFTAAAEGGLRLTCHAGEAAGPPSIRAALAYGVERIAHGATAIADPGLVAELAERRTVLDLCPTANFKCKAVPRLADHPLPALLRAGVRCTISTDSPTVAGVTLSEEYVTCATVLGLTEAELVACNEVAHAARFDR